MEIDFRDLLIKFFAEEISDEELVLLKTWLDKDTENRKVFDQENELWQETSNKTKLEYFNTDIAWNDISNRLHLRRNNRKSVTVIRNSTFKIYIAAASVACLLMLGALSLLITRNDVFNKVAKSSTTILTPDGEKAHISLSDSTTIILNSGSKIEYKGHFNLKDRYIKLEGEAFFNVHTNPKKPFVVQLEQMDISATGTKFNVLSYDNEDRVEATLEEGKIQISIEGREPIHLQTGQQAVFLKRSGKFEIRDVNIETYTSWKENKLRFNDAPLEEVFRRIGRKYNVTFDLTSSDLLNLKYTATFIDESIEEVMQYLKVVTPITYKIYYRNTVNNNEYLKPKIVVGLRNPIK